MCPAGRRRTRRPGSAEPVPGDDLHIVGAEMHDPLVIDMLAA